jgi:hypothetical protein
MTIDDAVMRVMMVSELDLPMDARTLQIQLRNRAAALCAALIAVDEEIPEDHRADLQDRWQYAQLMASVWQVHAYAVGQPLALEYVAAAFTAASRRAQTLADLIATEYGPPRPAPHLAGPTLVSDLIADAVNRETPP